MKKLLLLFTLIGFVLSISAQTVKTLNLTTAGTLSTALTATELSTVTNLTLTGTIDARDFKTMRDLMPLLAEIDLSGANIVAYSGTAGTAGAGNYYYSANRIPQNAFYNRNISVSKVGLTSFVFPASVTRVDSNAFYGCTGLTTISIPASLTSITSGAFNYCPALFNVDAANPNYSALDGVLFDKYKTILIQCPSLKTGTYVIPSTVKSISAQSFWACSGLTSITIPNSVTSIGNGAFTQCYGLTSVSIPLSVSSLDAWAFQNCFNLTAINVAWLVPLDLTNYVGIFNNVDKTTCTLNVPYGTASLYAAADQWKDFIHIVAPTNGFALDKNTVWVASATGSTATAAITTNVAWSASSNQTWLSVSPASANGNATLTFTATANTSIESRTAMVTVLSTGLASQAITVIQDGANAVKTITAGGLATTLTASELASVTQLTLTGTIDARDFKTMRDLMPLLASVDLSGTTIASYTGTEGPLSSNTIYPANGLPTYAFSTTNGVGKTGLTSITLPSTTTAVGAYALGYCSGLTSVNIPASVTSLGSRAFYICTNLTSVTFEPLSQLTFIGSYAFYLCNKLTSLTIPSTVNTIDNSFADSKISVTVDAGNASYSSLDGVLYNMEKTRLIYCPNTKIGSFTLPATVLSIQSEAFYNCTGLTSITLPNGFTTIESYAFENCTGLLSVYLPVSVNSISHGAFFNCSGLTTINANRTTPVDLSSAYDVFYNVSKTACTLVVPSGSVDLYKAAAQWKDFSFITSNRTPVANAGVDQTVNELTTVTLEGTASTDADNDVVTYHWTAPGGITLSSDTDGKPTFTAPEVSADTPYTFTLKVNDGTVDSAEDQVVITVKHVNVAPVANAGADQSVNEGTTVALDGTASSDFDSDAITYLWTAPAGITLSSATASKPTFTSPLVTQDTPFTFSLKVNDGAVDSPADQVVITVKQVDVAPVANAGADQSVNENATVTMDGSASSDFDTDPLTYLWTAPTGITLSSATAQKPTFTAPEVQANTDFTLTLVVNDGKANSLADQVVVTVKQVNKAPVSNAGIDQNVNENTLVTLDGTGSTDADANTTLTYLWTAPAGITLSSTTASKPTFTAPKVSKDTPYLFSLIVNDGFADSQSSQVVVTVKQVAPTLSLTSTLGNVSIPASELSYQLYQKSGASFLAKSAPMTVSGDVTNFELEQGDWIVLVSSSKTPAAFITIYSGNVISWASAEMITIPEDGNVTKTIACVAPAVTTTGTGVISGFIYSTQGTKSKSITVVRSATGSEPPVAGALVCLYKKGETLPIASCFSDANGLYKFDKQVVADYELSVEIPGYTLSARQSVKLNDNVTSASVIFAVNTTTMIITDIRVLPLADLTIYPNPFTGPVTIDLGEDGNELAEMAVYSIQGTLLMQQKLNETKTAFDLSGLVSGSYVVKVTSGKETQTKILIKK